MHGGSEMIFKPRDSGMPGFASDQEGPSVHLAAICDDLRRLGKSH